jgi:hypothetical protein
MLSSEIPHQCFEPSSPQKELHISSGETTRFSRQSRQTKIPLKPIRDQIPVRRDPQAWRRASRPGDLLNVAKQQSMCRVALSLVLLQAQPPTRPVTLLATLALKTKTVAAFDNLANCLQTQHFRFVHADLQSSADGANIPLGSSCIGQESPSGPSCLVINFTLQAHLALNKSVC